MSSSTLTPAAIPALQSFTEKLTRSNFPVRKALVMSALKGAQLSEFIEGKAEAPVETLASDDKKKTSNPEFVIFVAKQLQVLSLLLSSLSKEILEYVAAYPTPEEVWENLVAIWCRLSPVLVL
jgi:hypothetical protein